MNWSRATVTTVLVSAVALTACDATAAGPSEETTTQEGSGESSVEASHRNPGVPGPRGPAEILAFADELGLTAEQRSGIEAIAQELHTLNEPFWTEIRGDLGADGGPPPAPPGPGVALDDPNMRTIRANTRAAMEDAFALLTDEQVEQFHELRRERDGAAGPRGPHPGELPPQATLSDARGASTA